MHILVLVGPSGTRPANSELQARHERFIDDLDQANKVVLGGAWKPPVDGFEGAYLLSCESLQEARDIAESDPLFSATALGCKVVEWNSSASIPTPSTATRCSTPDAARLAVAAMAGTATRALLCAACDTLDHFEAHARVRPRGDPQ
jgi:hypothetical protein